MLNSELEIEYFDIIYNNNQILIIERFLQKKNHSLALNLRHNVYLVLSIYKTGLINGKCVFIAGQEKSNMGKI